ncbi:MAG: DNA polymerase Y family protein [Steroidobacteraceae bacterium]
MPDGEGAVRALEPCNAGVPASEPRSRELWLCLHFPRFALEAVAPHGAAGPAAVLDEGGRELIACDDLAERHGVHAGQGLDAALALCPGLVVHARDAAAEERLLAGLGRWLTQFTPLASLEPPDAVFAEVRGSLRLFGGARALRERMRATLAAQGLTPRIALAPTSRAALVAARAGLEVLVGSRAALPRLAARLPLHDLCWPERTRAALADLGLRSVADLARLPRDGFARRFGPACLDELDALLGRRAEPRRRVVTAERFDAGLELPAECGDTARILVAAGLLLERLEDFLRSRGAGITGIRLFCHHAGRRPASVATLGLVRPAATLAELLPLLRERLGQLPLPAPVVALRLRSTVIVPLVLASAKLWARSPQEGDAGAGARLVERLRARLGEEAVFGICLVDEHRPERAWSVTSPAAAVAGGIDHGGAGTRGTAASRTRGGAPAQALALPEAPRPLWMLAEPEPLAVREGRPCHHGALELLAGPERIETGWWDGMDVRRDYYIACSRAGLRLWIYRELGAGERWHLHGVFG